MPRNWRVETTPSTADVSSGRTASRSGEARSTTWTTTSRATTRRTGARSSAATVRSAKRRELRISSRTYRHVTPATPVTAATIASTTVVDERSRPRQNIPPQIIRSTGRERGLALYSIVDARCRKLYRPSAETGERNVGAGQGEPSRSHRSDPLASTGCEHRLIAAELLGKVERLIGRAGQHVGP